MADWLGTIIIIGIFLTMSGFSCTIDLNKFFSYIKKPKGILIGLFIQYGLLPLSAYFISEILNLESLHSIAFIITASCPGGTLSNFWCYFFGSNLELSIAMTASSSILSFVFLTISCIIYIPLISSDKNVKINYGSLAISVSSLIAGVIFGLLIAHKTKPLSSSKDGSPSSAMSPSSSPSSSNEPSATDEENIISPPSAPSSSTDRGCISKYLIKWRIKKLLIIVGGLSMLITLLLGAYENTLVSSVPAYELPFEIFLGGIILNLTSWAIAFILSYFICQLPNNQTITVCIECANQNVGLAIAIILLTMDRGSADVAVGFPMFYGVLNAIVIFIFGSVLRLCGFIQNNDDEINHKYENSGFTKLCQFIENHVSQKEKNSIDHHDNNGHNQTISNGHSHKNKSNKDEIEAGGNNIIGIEISGRDINNDSDASYYYNIHQQ